MSSNMSLKSVLETSNYPNTVVSSSARNQLKMDKQFLLTFFLFAVFIPISSSSSCPFDLSYVQTMPWDTSTCSGHPDEQHQCCQTLLSVLGVGLAEHLKNTSMFDLPDEESSSSCLSDFQAQLATLSVQPSLVPSCFKSTQFVTNSSSCAGIKRIQDWTEKVGMKTVLDSSCNGDLTGLTRCGSCVDAGMQITSQLTAMDPNSTKCFDFTTLYAAGIVNQFGPEDTRTASCILGMPLSRAATKGSSNKDGVLKLVFGLLGAVIGVLLAIALVMMYRRWDRKRKENLYHREVVSSVRASVLPNTGAKWFHLLELEKATNKFSQKNLIGQGSDGVVYKGSLSDGTLVAVKEILNLETKGDEEFCYEVEIISKIKHRNLLALRGCCVTSDNKGKRRFLVYDFMPNGNLGYQLSLTDANKLTWPQRKNIILDVAKGLAYLHYEIKPPIYHRDIKATNILLDSRMNAKVADFGLAKQGNEGQSHLTTRVAGTYGYLAPEYALYGQLTEKSDVYSFGIVILEVMSGRKVLDTSNSINSVVLITDWAWMLAKSGKMEEILDHSIREEGPKRIMERFVLVGILCAHVMVALRPTISEALKMLEGDIDIPELPDRPVPLGHESFQSSLLYGLQRSGRSTPYTSTFTAASGSYVPSSSTMS